MSRERWARMSGEEAQPARGKVNRERRVSASAGAGARWVFTSRILTWYVRVRPVLRLHSGCEQMDTNAAQGQAGFV